MFVGKILGFVVVSLVLFTGFTWVLKKLTKD